jgi:hypothetical protein
MMDHVPTWLSYFLLACHLWMTRAVAYRMLKATFGVTARTVVALARHLVRTRKCWLVRQSQHVRHRPSSIPDPIFDGLVAGTTVLMFGIYLAT